MKLFKVLCIGGSDSCGGAGIQADLKAISACGCWGTSVITAVTAQNTCGVSGIFPVVPRFIGKQMETVLSDVYVDAVKTGMLLSPEIISVVAKKVKKHGLSKMVVDPVMMAKGGKALLEKKALTTLIKDLLPLAYAVTPNVPEAETLAKMAIGSVADMKEAALKIHDLGVENVLIKGGHLPSNGKTDVTDILYNGNYYEFSSERINKRHLHGTGCTYASALAAGIAKGNSIMDSALQARILMIAAIKNAVDPGKGYGSVNVFGEYLRNKC
jgi:hydroxymethylpyrimidine kinase/phosphomethylpyrimidine kinase